LEKGIYPDFMIEVDKKTMYVLDAKHYASSMKGKEPDTDILKQLTWYMVNIPCNKGALIFPYAPDEDYKRTKPGPGYTVDYLKMTPGWKSAMEKIRNQTFEFIFEQISKHVNLINFKSKDFPG
jgi:hypothetical protein